MKKFIIITTINHKSKAITRFENRKDWNIVVVGDKKSPFIPSSSNLTFLPVETQLELNFKFAQICPYNHYSRKNIGYLYALRQGAEIIYDTDDDNIPYDHWKLPDFSCGNCINGEGGRFINIYRHFSDEFTWPRGFPLDEIKNSQNCCYSIDQNQIANIGIWQGLSDNEPDIDAIYRLIIGEKITFRKGQPVYLPRGSFCPINSQNTFWHKKAFPYLYLPAGISFRFTDILRGYIAQFLLWRQGLQVGVNGPTVYQERNPHDLMKDFHDEIGSYLQVKRVVEILENLELGDVPLENLRKTYEALHKDSIVPMDELKYLDAWLEDFEGR